MSSVLSTFVSRLRVSSAGLALVAAATLPARPAVHRTAARATLTGTYTLRSVNGKPLPVTLMENEAGKIELIAGSATFEADGNYQSELTTRGTSGGQTKTDTEKTEGTYEVSGSTLTIHPSDGDAETATIDGDTITSTPSEGSKNKPSMVFRK